MAEGQINNKFWGWVPGTRCLSCIDFYVIIFIILLRTLVMRVGHHDAAVWSNKMVIINIMPKWASTEQSRHNGNIGQRLNCYNTNYRVFKDDKENSVEPSALLWVLTARIWIIMSFNFHQFKTLCFNNRLSWNI